MSNTTRSKPVWVENYNCISHIFLSRKRSPFDAFKTNGILTFLDRSLSIVSTVQSAISHLTVNFTQDLFPFVSVLKFIEFKLSTKKLPKKICGENFHGEKALQVYKHHLTLFHYSNFLILTTFCISFAAE